MNYTQEFLNDLAIRRGIGGVGHDPIWFLERSGATIIEPTSFEPDPTTHRHSYYYNVLTNTLFKKVVTHSEPGIITAHWQKVSD